MFDKLTRQYKRNCLSILFCVGLFGACSPESFVAGSAALVGQSDMAEAQPAAGPAALELPLKAPEPATAAVTPASYPSGGAFPVKGVLELDNPLRHGDYAWSEEGAPSGQTTIVVDVQAQVLYVYRGGYEIGRAAILYGADDKPTPTGTFTILEKKRHHISNLYGAPMPYMMRLTWDGIAIHASEVEWGSATHGCVGIPDEFAALLFANAKIGDRVLVTTNWRTDVYRA